MANKISGSDLLNTPTLNKGTAFTSSERKNADLLGLLPIKEETIEQQVTRAWQQVNSYTTTLHKNIFLMDLHNTNEVLFYSLIKAHLEELMPIVYTPTVGAAVQNFSNEFRKPPRALYITPKNINDLDAMFERYVNNDIRLIVVTDGEGVLGIGDQGVGSVYISVAKLALYSLFAGINPANTLPVVLDVGTNNQLLLDNPLYLGVNEKRLQGKAYDDFIAAFVGQIQKKLPNALLHWEDFGRDNAYKNLAVYREKICSFNDDIQGTGVVTLAAMLAGVYSLKAKLKDQRIVVLGAGSAGTGIADQIYNAMRRSEGVDEETARKCFWLVGRYGMMIDNQAAPITEGQRPYTRTAGEVIDWDAKDKKAISLLEVIKNVKPTILVGTSGVSRAFTQEIVQEMAKHVERPMIFPLSNPTDKSEAIPEEVLNWTNGKALIGTGSPFAPVNYKGKQIRIAQCNNALAFPGIGLGAIAVKAKQITDEMFWKACEVLYKSGPILQDPNGPLLPSVKEAANLARKVAIAVAEQAIKEGMATLKGDPEKLVKDLVWEPKYK